MDQTEFTQAGIDVENREAFQELQGRVARALGPAAERFLQSLTTRRIRIREFEELVAQGLLKDAARDASPKLDQELYRALTLSDQGLMREFYLTVIEQVPDELRHKFHAVYRY
jgi:two-component sensor histidine kinase